MQIQGRALTQTEIQAIVNGTGYSAEMLDVTIRRTYMLAGQAIATKVTGYDNPESNGTFFLYTDHLGSTSVLVNNLNAVVAGSDTRHLPFGGYRIEPTHDVTDRGYTGHLENRGIGLTYINARFYVPSIGKFATADTIVPDSANPQAFNRYSYVYNNSLILTDPSGHDPAHCADQYESAGDPACNHSSLPDSRYLYIDGYGWFDTDHLFTSVGKAESLLREIQAVVAAGGGIIERSGGIGSSDGVEILGRNIGAHSFISLQYEISGSIKPEEIPFVALGILLDFDIQFEEWQGEVFGGSVGFSSFAIEDLPSDYIGFIAGLTGVSVESILASLGPVQASGEPPRAEYLGPSSTTTSSVQSLANERYSPLDIDENGNLVQGAWPSHLQMTPIESSSGLWSRLNTFEQCNFGIFGRGCGN